MIRKHTKKVKEKAAEVAKRTAKQVGSELIEIPDQAVKEVTGGKDERISPIVEAMQMQTNVDTPQGETGETPEKRLDYLEKELEALKQKRNYQVEQERLEAQREEKEEGPKPPIEPPAKSKRGLPGFGKKKTKGTGELLKSKK